MDSALPLLSLSMCCFIYVCSFVDAQSALLSLDSIKIGWQEEMHLSPCKHIKNWLAAYMQLYSLVMLSVCYKSVGICLLGHDGCV